VPHWYIETWSPQDGIAFAQKCEANERDNPILTVAIGPPAWQPFEVSAASARRAERGPYQVRLWQDSGIEIAFATLGDLINIVRQAYIGAGGGPIDEEERVEPLVPDDGNGIEHDLDALSQQWDSIRARFLGPDGNQAAERFASELEGNLGRTFESLFAQFAARYRQSLTPSQTETQDGLDFERAVARMGYPAFPRWYGDVAQVVRMLRDLLFRVPPPYPFTVGKRGSRCSSLGDCLTYAMSSRHHLLRISAPDFAVLFFAACTIVSGTGVHERMRGSGKSWASQIRLEAARWLYRERPQVDPASPAGLALQEHLA
jgi:hypothetical protein